MLLSAGQDGDNPMLMPLLKAHGANNADELGRLLADKAYSHPSTRTRLRALKIKHTIPERSDQIGRRKAKGSAGGRPPAFDSRIYVHRNTVERGFNRLKQWRGIATRYDKYALTYLGGVTLAAIVIHHRVRSKQTRPRTFLLEPQGQHTHPHQGSSAHRRGDPAAAAIGQSHPRR